MTDFETMLQEFQQNLMTLSVYEAQLKCQAADEMWQETKAKRKQAEETLEEYRYNREYNKLRHRPSQNRWVEIEFDSEKNQWKASHQNVIAYGDTPEMACDNFDHLWVFGDSK